jgi:transposase
MKQLVFSEQLVTPGKKFSAIKEAIKNLNSGHFAGRDKDGNILYDTQVYFDEADLTLRLVVSKTYKEQEVKTKSGNKKVVNGHYLKERVITFHSYLTNIPQETLSAAQVINTYSKRWSIEHFFKELNNYGLKVLPSIDYRTVQNHVALVLLMYMLVTLFKKALGGAFATCSLKTLNKNFFRASLRRISREYPDLFPQFYDENGQENDFLNRLYSDQRLLLPA